MKCATAILECHPDVLEGWTLASWLLNGEESDAEMCVRSVGGCCSRLRLQSTRAFLNIRPSPVVQTTSFLQFLFPKWRWLTAAAQSGIQSLAAIVQQGGPLANNDVTTVGSETQLCLAQHVFANSSEFVSTALASSSLRRLDATGCRFVTGMCRRLLAASSPIALTSLAVSGTQVDDPFVSLLSVDESTIECLHLQKSIISGVSVASLGRAFAATLTALDVSDSKKVDSVAALATCSALTSLNVSRTSVSSLAELYDLPRLVSLEASGCSELRAVGPALAKSRALRVLRLSRCSSLTSVCLDGLGSIGTLIENRCLVVPADRRRQLACPVAKHSKIAARGLRDVDAVRLVTALWWRNARSA